VDICARLGVSYELDETKTQIIDDQQRNIGEMLLNGVPDQVTAAVPDEYSIHVATVGTTDIGVLGLGIDTWYLRIADQDRSYFVGAVSGRVVLAQVYMGKPYELYDKQAYMLESRLEGVQ